MALETTNYSLWKPEGADLVRDGRGPLAATMDLIDSLLFILGGGVVTPPVVITITPNGIDTTLPQGTISIAYSQILSASGGTGPYTWAVTAGTLPTGLSLNTSTGAITGTPSAAATFTFSVTATDANDDQRTASYELVIGASAASNATDTDNFDDNSINGTFWATAGTVSETGGRARSNEGGSFTTNFTRDISAKYPTVQMFADSHATAQTTFEVANNAGDLFLRIINDNTIANYHDSVLADSPVGYWRLGETSGTTAADSSGNSRDGTYTGGYTLNQTSLLTSDTADKSVLVNGSTGYVTVPSAPALRYTNNGTLTIGAWIKITALPSSGQRACIVSKSDDNNSGNNWEWALEIDDAGNACGECWQVNGGASRAFFTTSGVTLATGTTYHLVLTIDNTVPKMELFINGVSRGSTTTFSGSPPTAGAAPVNIGRSNNGDRYFNGVIDEVAIYPSVLSSDRITAHYNAGTGASGTGAVNVKVVDGGSTVVNSQYAVAASGEYFRIYAGANTGATTITFQRSTDAGTTWTTMRTWGLADGTRIAASKAKLTAANSGGNNTSRYAEWDNFTIIAPPSAPSAPAGTVEIWVWESLYSVYLDNGGTGRSFAYHHQLNGYGVDGYAMPNANLAGFGGNGAAWSSASPGVNDQTLMGTATTLSGVSYVNRPLYHGVNFRPGDNNTPAWSDTTGWTNYCNAMRYFAEWAMNSDFTGFVLDMEGGTRAWQDVNATEATARARGHACGVELMTALLTGWPSGLNLRIYNGDLPRAWRAWQDQWYNGTADAVYNDSMLPDFWAGMTSVAGFDSIKWLAAAFYRDTQGGNPAPDFFTAMSRDVYGWNPNGTITDRFGNSHNGLRGYDWYFHNKFNEAGQVAKLGWAPFFWIDNHPGDSNSFEANSNPPVVAINQFNVGAQFALSLPYTNPEIWVFNFQDGLEFTNPASQFGGYASYAACFAH